MAEGTGQHVWVIGSGEYEQWAVDGVAVSLEAAEALVKSWYPAPYVVTWRPLQRKDDDNATLVGEFEGVPGYSTAHNATFDFMRHVLADESSLELSA